MSPLPWRDAAAAELAVLANGHAGGDLGGVLEDLVAFVRRYVVLRDEQATAIALWVAHTYVYERGDQSPILAVTSAERRSGKSRLFDVLELLVAHPWRCVRPSEAVLFRKIDRDHPTLMVDEGDTLWADRSGAFEGLRAIFNAGNRRGSPIPRVVVKGRGEMVLVDFDIFCPKAIAGIGGLPATVVDRAIVIRMTRRRQGELVDRLRERLARRAAEPLRKGLAAPFEGLETLTVAEDLLPAELDDRARDGWEPLLAIADAAGGAWPLRARAAAVLLAVDREDAAEDTESLALRLLRDLRDLFESDGSEAIASRVLVERLLELEDGPWRSLGRDEKTALTPDRMRRLLSRYAIRPGKFRASPGAPQQRGYSRVGLSDAWDRYLFSLPQVSRLSQVPQSGDADRAEERPAETPEPPETPVEAYNRTPCATCGAEPVGTYRDGGPRYGCGPHAPIWPAS